MIIDKIDNIMFYAPIVKNLKNGMEAVHALRSYEAGRYEFDGGYFMIQRGETKPMEEGTFEAHRKYVDVQIVVEGSEEVAWAEVTDLTMAVPYDSVKDAERLDGEKTHTMMISQGMFYIAYPHDAHKPVSHTKRQQSYTKIVMKLPEFDRT